MKTITLLTLFCSLTLAHSAKAQSELPASALDLISQLQKSKITVALPEKYILNYVKDKDLEKLFKLIDSKEPCAHVQMMISSHLPTEDSTVGDEAAYLISSYLKRFYPTKPCSSCDKPNKDSLKEWYRQYQAAKLLKAKKM